MSSSPHDEAPGRPISWRLPLIILAVPALLVLLVGTALVFQVQVGAESIVSKLARFLDPNGEANAWAWYSSMLLVSLAVAFGTKAVARRAAGAPFGGFVFLSAVALYLSLDEATELHERSSNLVSEALGHTRWVIFGVPLAVIVGVMCLWLLRRESRRLVLRLVLGGTVFLSGAVGVEVLANLAPSGTYPLWTALEESLEIAGVLIALWGALEEVNIRLSPTGMRIPG